MRLLLLATATCLTFLCVAGENNTLGETITTQNGDKVTMSAINTRTIHIKNRDKEVNKTVDEAYPIFLNGKTIFNRKYNTSEDVMHTDAQKNAPDEYILARSILETAIAEEKKELKKGKYVFKLRQMIVNEEGKIVFYKTDGICRMKDNPHNENSDTYLRDLKPIPLALDDNITQKINTKLTEQISKIQYTPLVLEDQTIPYLSSFTYFFEIT